MEQESSWETNTMSNLEERTCDLVVYDLEQPQGYRAVEGGLKGKHQEEVRLAW